MFEAVSLYHNGLHENPRHFVRGAGRRQHPARINLHTVQARHAQEAVCEYAVEHGFDLLVIGRHGEGGLIHPKLGHVAETAAKTCKIPVLLVSAA